MPMPDRNTEKSDLDKKKLRARSDLNVSLNRGQVLKMPCTKCGAHDTQAHHPDYSYSLEVMWLCRACHEQIHPRKKSQPHDQ